MKIQSTVINGLEETEKIVILSIKGEIDVYTIPKLNTGIDNIINELLREIPKSVIVLFVINMEKVSYIDSEGIRYIIELKVKLSEIFNKICFYIINNSAQRKKTKNQFCIKEILIKTNLSFLFKIFETLEECLKELGLTEQDCQKETKRNNALWPEEPRIKIIELGIVLIDFGIKDDPERIQKMVGNFPCHVYNRRRFLCINEWPEGQREEKLRIVNFPKEVFNGIRSK